MLKVELLLSPSNPQSSSTYSPQILTQSSPISVAQAKNVGIKSSPLFLTSHILYPLGNPEHSIFKIIFRIQTLFTIPTTALLVQALTSLISNIQ